jgi:hypothetical protein
MAKSLVKLTDEEYNKRLPRIRIRLRRSARARHRFKNRSFTLNDSINTKYNRRKRTIRLITRDEIFARKKNHNGFNYTRAVIRRTHNNFLQNAQRRETGYIKEQFDDAISSAVIKYNKQKGAQSGRSVHNGI